MRFNLLQIDFSSNQIARLSAFLVMSGVLILHFNYFSILHFKGLNSDHAIHILMSERLSLPYGLYYWGQNRLGSLIPILGHIFHLLGFKALFATAIAQALLLLSAVYFFGKFVRSPFLKLAVLTVMILPVYPFFTQVEIGHPVIGQMFFIGLSLFLYYFRFSHSWWTQLLFGLTAALSLWASELSVAVWISLVVVENIRLWKNIKAKPIFAPLGFVLGVLFILFAKNNVAKVAGYHYLFASVSSAFDSIGNHFASLLQMMAFDSNKPFNSVLVYSLVLICLLMIGLGAKRNLRPSRPTLLFLLSSLITLLAVHFSNWNEMMGRPLHHFTPAYFFFFMAFINYAQQLMQEKAWAHYAILLPVAVQAYASIAFITTFNLDVSDRINRKDAVQLATQVDKDFGLEQFTVIGNYWNTYIIDALNEELIAVPHQEGHVRNDRYLDEAMANEDYILIKNGWLKEFPDTTYQWGQTLVRNSAPDTLNNTVYAHYKKLKSE